MVKNYDGEKIGAAYGCPVVLLLDVFLQRADVRGSPIHFYLHAIVAVLAALAVVWQHLDGVFAVDEAE
jgi:hypothetical protein